MHTPLLPEHQPTGERGVTATFLVEHKASVRVVDVEEPRDVWVPPLLRAHLEHDSDHVVQALQILHARDGALLHQRHHLVRLHPSDATTLRRFKAEDAAETAPREKLANLPLKHVPRSICGARGDAARDALGQVLPEETLDLLLQGAQTLGGVVAVSFNRVHRLRHVLVPVQLLAHLQCQPHAFGLVSQNPVKSHLDYLENLSVAVLVEGLQAKPARPSFRSCGVRDPEQWWSVWAEGVHACHKL
mmetsp:Transcript_98410/g.228217  ORF Transcript_98410/g.228217 Transcript_98410/m.228217 type:complete len:245 (+) Transcript_98410:631-1365(+)